MNEQNQHEANGANRSAQPLPNPSNGVRYDASETPRGPRRPPAPRHAVFPKDDRRSSTLLTERERAERWPLG